MKAQPPEGRLSFGCAFAGAVKVGEDRVGRCDFTIVTKRCHALQRKSRSIDIAPYGHGFPKAQAWSFSRSGI